MSTLVRVGALSERVSGTKNEWPTLTGVLTFALSLLLLRFHSGRKEPVAMSLVEAAW